MGRVRPASATSEAIEAEVLLKVWDVLHPRAVGEGEGERNAADCESFRAERAQRSRCANKFESKFFLHSKIKVRILQI